MSDKCGACRDFHDCFCNFVEFGSIGYHLVVYPCQFGDIKRDITFRVDKAFKRPYDRCAIMNKNRYFCYFALSGTLARRFYINNAEQLSNR